MGQAQARPFLAELPAELHEFTHVCTCRSSFESARLARQGSTPPPPITSRIHPKQIPNYIPNRAPLKKQISAQACVYGNKSLTFLSQPSTHTVYFAMMEFGIWIGIYLGYIWEVIGRDVGSETRVAQANSYVQESSSQSRDARCNTQATARRHRKNVFRQETVDRGAVGPVTRHVAARSA